MRTGRALSASTPAGRARRAVIPVAAALGSLALHALLLTPLLLGAAQHRTRAPEAPGDSLPSSHDAALTVVLLDDGDSKPRAPPRLSDTPVRSITLRDLPAPSPDPAIADSVPQAQGDAAAFALLYGRYLGQITARIERAWMRPRTSPGGPTFACRIEVLQDERGQVLGVTVGRCNEDSRWRASLVDAIRSASPLPAAPDPKVFRRSLALGLTAAAFVPGGNTQGFEPQTLTTMSTQADGPASIAPPTYLDQLRALRDGRPGNVDLRIEGGQRTNVPLPNGSGPQ